MTTDEPAQPSLELILYITKLKEPIDLYQRYFDALLIKRNRQDRFFRDLKQFRRQPQIISLFQNLPGRSVDQLRASNKEVTRHFLNSTYSHPWCHASNVKSPNLNSKAERRKSNFAESPVGSMAEEARLHKLLVPIWCVFRGRMNPTQKQLDEFCAQEAENGRLVSAENPASDAGEGGKKGKWALGGPVIVSPTQSRMRDDSDGDNKAGDYTDNDDSSIDSEGAPRPKSSTAVSPGQEDDENAQAIGKLFVGAATASFFLQNKRVRKYLLKKSKK